MGVAKEPGKEKESFKRERRHRLLLGGTEAEGLVTLG